MSRPRPGRGSAPATQEEIDRVERETLASIAAMSAPRRAYAERRIAEGASPGLAWLESLTVRLPPSEAS